MIVSCKFFVQTENFRIKFFDRSVALHTLFPLFQQTGPVSLYARVVLAHKIFLYFIQMLQVPKSLLVPSWQLDSNKHEGLVM